MAKLQSYNVAAKLTVTLELEESEVRALSGIFGYSVDAFLAAFYEKMGKAYVQPYEAGVRSLHETVSRAVGGPIEKIDQARMAMRLAAKQEK